ncbi:MAG: DUF3501 family protein [Candidatus Eiseniibacteriota bacterium]
MTTTTRVQRGDILDLNTYDRGREEAIRKAIDLKNRRRVQLGDRVSLAFENRETVLFQVHEMLRAERIFEEERIREELEVYNELMPGNGELSATLFIEITAQDRIETDLNSLMGIEECLWMEIGDQHRLKAWFEPGHSKEAKISAVHYVRFRLSPQERDAFRAGRPVVLTLDHPHYHARVELPAEQVRELAPDLD